MLRKLPLMIGLLLVLTGIAVPVAAVPAPSDLQNALGAQDLSVGTYVLLTDDLRAFYEKREFKPAWNFAGPENATAFASFLGSIEQMLDYHGLRHEDYAFDDMRKLAAQADDDSHLKLELLTTDTLLRLAHDLHGDNNELNDLYPGWDFQRVDVDIPTLLGAAIGANGLNEFIGSMSPQQPAYTQLARALMNYRNIAAQGGWKPVDAGSIVRAGYHDPRVSQIYARLAAEDYLPKVAMTHDDMYDEDIKKAVAAYQLRNGLGDDGNTGPFTIEAMNISVDARIDQIRANMERWRHMPGDFPPPRDVMVNIPDASIDITEEGKVIYRGPVVVGRVDRKTPFIDSIIRSMIINPAWHVPVKIAKKDILPKLRKDPHYLEKLGFVIAGNKNDPYGDNINWETMPAQEFNFRLRQSPGDMNSLGRLKFDFANDFAVYMHGTPHQELFDKHERDFSSGCVRLRDPENVAEILMTGTKGGWTVQKISEEIQGGKTQWVGLASPMPIYVVYWTVFADESGATNFRKDVYGYDDLLMHPIMDAPVKP